MKTIYKANKKGFLFFRRQQVDVTVPKSCEGELAENALIFRVNYKLHVTPGKVQFRLPKGYQLVDMSAEELLLDINGKWKTKRRHLTEDAVDLHCIVRDLRSYCNTSDCRTSNVINVNYAVEDGYVPAKLTVSTEYTIDINSEVDVIRGFADIIDRFETVDKSDADYRKEGVAATELHGTIRKKLISAVNSALEGKIPDTPITKNDVTAIVSDPTWQKDVQNALLKDLYDIGFLVKGLKFSVSDPFGAEWEAFIHSRDTIRHIKWDGEVIDAFKDTTDSAKDVDPDAR